MLRLLLVNELVSDLSNGNSEGPTQTSLQQAEKDCLNVHILLYSRHCHNGLRLQAAVIHLAFLLAILSTCFSTPSSTHYSATPG